MPGQSADRPKMRVNDSAIPLVKDGGSLPDHNSLQIGQDPARRATEPLGPRKWVHGVQPERGRPRPGEEPPRTSGELRTALDRIER